MNASLTALTQALTDALRSHVAAGSEDPRSEDFSTLSAAQTMTALCQQYHKAYTKEEGADHSSMDLSLLDRVTPLLDEKGVRGDDASAKMLSRELKKVRTDTLLPLPIPAIFPILDDRPISLPP